MKKSKKAERKEQTANLGFEAKLWSTADKLRNNMDAAEYKHVVLGLIFLKYISDSFEEMHAKLKAGKGDYAGSKPEDPDEYRAQSIFWAHPSARWLRLAACVCERQGQRSARSSMPSGVRGCVIDKDAALLAIIA